MGRLSRRPAFPLLAASLAAWALSGCASGPSPGEGPGVWHVVAPGDTLWRLSQRYGSSVKVLEDTNDIDDARRIRVGQRLWVPNGRDRGPRSQPAPSQAKPPMARLRRSTDCALSEREGIAFSWPVDGSLSSSFGPRDGRRHDGIDLAAPKGTPVKAAEGGRIIYSGSGLGSYGNVVIVKHTGRWATVYAHNRRNLARRGSFVEKGDVIAEVGDSGNASGTHLHFEVRRSNVAQDPLGCLP